MSLAIEKKANVVRVYDGFKAADPEALMDFLRKTDFDVKPLAEFLSVEV